jgi:excisionase family DNA binding protein
MLTHAALRDNPLLFALTVLVPWITVLSRILGGVTMRPRAVVSSASKKLAVKQPAIKSTQRLSIPLPERPTLTVNEFCKMVGIGRSTFYKAVEAGDLKVRKYGRRTFVTQEELKRFVEKMPFG